MKMRIESALSKMRMNLMEKILKEEKGASEMVAVIVIIAIVIVLAGIFSKELQGVVQDVFDRLSTFVNGLA